MLRQSGGLVKEDVERGGSVEGGVVGEEGRREIGDSVRDSQASAPSEFDISSTEVEQALRTQGKTCSMLGIMSETIPLSHLIASTVYIFFLLCICVYPY